jgi:peptidoglycan/xylan/chitin deacetylase (PgdA/CDA1 family)
MNLAKSISRKVIFPSIVYFGLEKCFSAFTSKQCLILNYHGVVKHFNQKLSRNHLSVNQFQNHLTYFKNNFNVVSLTEAFDIYHNGLKPKKKTVVITFDDGYLNNLTNALPLLKFNSFPATVFVTAQSVVNPLSGLWYDQIDLLSTKVAFKQFQNTMKSGFSTISQFNSFSELKQHIKYLNNEEKKNLLDRINNIPQYNQFIYSCDEEYWRILNVQELIYLASEKDIEIGSHGYSHSNLDNINEEMLQFELKESKQILEKTINKKIDAIAFPDGAYNDEVKKISIETGYNKLLAVNYRMESDRKDKYILPRLSISNTTTYESVIISVNRAFANMGY